MRNLWNNLDEVKKTLKSPLILLLDFDGTLAPIEQLPHEAFLPEKTREVITKIAGKENFFVGIVSGRKLEDLQSKIKIPGLIYGGNHGLEGEIFEKKYSFPFDKNWPSLMQKIKNQVLPIISRFEGVFIEDKKISFSIHYRKLDEKILPDFLAVLRPVLIPYQENSLIDLTPGKKVFDILPDTSWHKGRFVKTVIREIKKQTGKPPGVIFIGDDITDESAFEILPGDLTIRVGKNDNSKANLFVQDIQEVFKFLNWLNLNWS